MSEVVTVLDEVVTVLTAGVPGPAGATGPAGTIGATGAAGATGPVDTAHVLNPLAAHGASAVSFVPTGSLVGSDVQAALVALVRGLPRVRGPFPVVFDNPLFRTTGVPLFTPEVGEILLGNWYAVDTAFDGAPSVRLTSSILWPAGLSLDASRLDLSFVAPGGSARQCTYAFAANVWEFLSADPVVLVAEPGSPPDTQGALRAYVLTVRGLP